VINIKEDGAMVVSGKAYDVQAVSEMLRRVAKEDPNRNVLIRADERSIMKYFAAVARQCREAGFNEVRIGYVFDSQPPKP
jgi:biopolymer transport protein ExbD